MNTPSAMEKLETWLHDESGRHYEIRCWPRHVILYLYEENLNGFDAIVGHANCKTIEDAILAALAEAEGA